MDKVSRTITVYVTGNKCNLSCSYCYIKNSRYDEEIERIELLYDINHMIKSFDASRIGGIADITVIGNAETLLADSIIEFIHGLLKLGHVVSVVTNATISKRINELINIDKEYLKRLIVKASFHYLELKRLGLIESYFENIRNIAESGASVYPFVTISNEYVPYIDEISRLCMKYLGIKPQCSPCNKIDGIESIMYKSEFEPVITEDLYANLSEHFDMRIFDEIISNKKLDTQKHFCYAGKWGYGVNYKTGEMSKCHNIPIGINFYSDNNFMDKLEPVGCSCGIESCCLQYNFFSEGLLPDYWGNYLYGDMIYIDGYINEEVRDLLNVRFDETYERFELIDEYNIAISEKNKQITRLLHENRYNYNPFFNEIIYKKQDEGKKIYIYGIGNKYKKYKHTIGFKVEGLIDTYKSGEYIDGKVITNLEEIALDSSIFIVVTVIERTEIDETLKAKGLVEGENYI